MPVCLQVYEATVEVFNFANVAAGLLSAGSNSYADAGATALLVS